MTQNARHPSRALSANDDVRRVKDACDIVRIVGEHVALKPKGREFVALCPFHSDSSPSMTVVPTKQIFHCFACGTGGDVLGFVQKYLKMDFREALEYLAERSGVTLTPRTPQRGASQSNDANAPTSRADLLKACAFAQSFFQGILRHQEHGTEARAILDKRGVSDAMISTFAIGASPDRWDGLFKTIASKNLPLRPFIDAGLLKPRDDGSAYDALRHRVIFPIQDAAGRVIAFGGRRIRDEDDPKYLNSPETRLFSKSATLYGLPQASRTIQSTGTAIITEGYMDAIACHQGGFANAVATLGTALTREHATILRRLCHTVVLLFDGDQAGQRAADRAAEIFFAETIDVKIATLAGFTDAKDPDELLKREGGAEIFRRVIDQATDLLDYRFARLRERLAGQGGAAMARAIEEELARLVDLGLSRVAPVRQRLIIKRLAQLAGVDETTVLRAVPVGRSGPARVYEARPEPGSSQGPSDEERAEVAQLTRRPLDPREHLMACVLCEGELYSTLDAAGRELISDISFQLDALRTVARAIESVAEREEPTAPSLANVLDELTAMIDEQVSNDLASQIDLARQAAVAIASRVHELTRGDTDALHANWRSTLSRAMLDRDAAATAPPPQPAASTDSADSADLLGLIELKRRMEERRKAGQVAPDRRILPKPR